MFPEDLVIDAINDSKQMTEEEREEVYEELMANDQVIKSVCVIDHERIDEINILEATMQAMAKSVEGLSTRADWVLIDGNRIPPALWSIERRPSSRATRRACASPPRPCWPR